MQELAPHDFREAVRHYAFSHDEPIYGLPLGADDLEPSLQVEFACLVRQGGKREDWHALLSEFWASALCEFVEYYGEEERFHELGENGAYVPVEAEEASKILGGVAAALSKSFTKDSGASLQGIRSCYLVHDSTTLKSLAGTDDRGFFAFFWVPKVSC